MPGPSWGFDHLPPPEVIAQIHRDARRLRSEFVAELLANAGRGIQAGVRKWFHQQPAAPFAGSVSGRGR